VGWNYLKSIEKMNRKTYLIIFPLLFVLLLSPAAMNGQCKIENNAFVSGEKIVYDLYFSFGILNARAGKGSLSVTDANYRGVNAYKTVMTLNTSGLVGNIYSVNDTLTSFVDKDLRPLLFTKEAAEAKDYSVERQAYTYHEGNGVSIRALRTWNGEERFDETVTTDKCTYDYLSVLSYVRNIDYTGMQPGDRTFIQFISGRRPVQMFVNYMGTSSIKANNGKRYEVIDITMTIQDDAFTNQKEALKASLTNDENRLPVVIDTHLKKGVVRAVLKDVSGLRH
jgi:hypothetical protein